MRTTSASALLAVLLASTHRLHRAAAHFTLDSPKSFGFDEDKENQVPCGGFSIEGATRSPWYWKGGPVQIDSHHDTATVNIRISYAPNPTRAEDFTAVPALQSNLQLKGEGEFCFPIDASAVPAPQGTPAPGPGTNATLLVEFISTVHGALYQCAAVRFVDSAAEGAGSGLDCTGALVAGPPSSSSSGEGDDGDGDDHDDGDGHDHGGSSGSNSTATATATPSSSASGSGSAPSSTSSTTAPASQAGAASPLGGGRVPASGMLAIAAGLVALGLGALL